MAWRARAYDAGFTLIEILVAVAILAILSAALAPMVVKYVSDGRVARALSDAQTIAGGVIGFQLDTGRWPVRNDGTVTSNGNLDRLIGVAEANLGNPLPGRCTGAGSAVNWGSSANADAMEAYLVRNQNATANPLYPVSPTPSLSPGWNGPYVSSIPLDPWGNPYVVNVRYLDGSGRTNATAESNHAVFVLSTGPDGCWSTSFANATPPRQRRHHGRRHRLSGRGKPAVAPGTDSVSRDRCPLYPLSQHICGGGLRRLLNSAPDAEIVGE